jgi:NADH-ubiquinone oxidoreductase chain 2
MSHFNISSIFTNNSYFENNLMYNMIPELIDNNSFFNFSKIFFNSNLIQNLLLFVSLCSLIIGTVVGLNQIKIKRLLTFSTISHVGFLLLSLSLNTENAVQSFIFYIFQYSLSNLNIFLILLTIGYMNYYKQLSHQKLNYNTLDLYKGKFLNKNKSISDIGLIEEIKGLFYNFPLLCISFSICLFSMAGTPPLIGFFAKQQLLFSTMYSGFYFMSFVVIIVSVISASYYLKLIRVLCFEKPNMNETVRYLDSDYQSLNIKNKSINDDNIINSNLNILFFFNKSKLFINNYHGLAISILTLFILLFIVKSSLFLNSANLIAETSFIC